MAEKLKKNNKLRHNEYYDTQEAFDKLYIQSKEGKTFKNLMKYITSSENIRLAYRNIKNNGGSSTSGVDRKIIKDLESIEVNDFVEEIKHKFKNYQPKAVKRVEIPKPNGKTRPLGIPTIHDRVIQQCILQVLEPICEAKFHKNSNGFRPNRSVENAIAQCDSYMQVANLLYGGYTVLD